MLYTLSVLFSQAEELIIKGFPAKIVELNQLLETPQFNQKDPSKLHQDLNIPVPEPITFSNRYENNVAAGRINYRT